MIITSAANLYYETLAQAWRDSVLQYGHIERMYNLGGLSFGIPVDTILAKNPTSHPEVYRAKPVCMEDARTQCQGTVIWLDADCIITDTIEDTDDYDIGFRAKPREDGKRVKLKAGAVYMRDTEGCHNFLNRWLAAIPADSRGDQTPMNKLIQSYYPLTNDIVGKVLDIDGVRVKIFDKRYLFEVHNMGDLARIPEGTKVIHFMGDWSLSKQKIKLPTKLKLLERYRERNIRT